MTSLLIGPLAFLISLHNRTKKCKKTGTTLAIVNGHAYAVARGIFLQSWQCRGLEGRVYSGKSCAEILPLLSG